MVSREEFKKYLFGLIKDDSKEMNLKYINKNYTGMSLFLIVIGFLSIFVGVAVFNVFSSFYMLIIVGILAIISGFVRLYKSSKIKEYYKDKYREKIMSFLFGNHKYSFDRHGKIDSSIFKASQFEGRYEKYCGSDIISINISNDDGSASNNYLTLCDLNVTKTETDSDGNSRTVTVYKGVFGYIEFPFEFKSILCLNTKYKKDGFNLEKITLEDIQFSKKIGVYCNDQIEARYILTPDMMEKLLYLANRVGTLRMTLVDNKMYIGFENTDLFELSDVKDDKLETAFEKFYDEIDVLLKLVDEIKTNNKIFKI